MRAMLALEMELSVEEILVYRDVARQERDMSTLLPAMNQRIRGDCVIHLALEEELLSFP